MNLKIILATLFVILFCKGFAQGYVRITKPIADIRFHPSTSADLIVQAKYGNIFEIVNEKESWYEIVMFSGEYRYVEKSDCEKADVAIVLTDDEKQKETVFKALRDAEDKAQADADTKYPIKVGSTAEEVEKNIAYFRLLLDGCDLQIMNENEFQAPTYRRLVIEGVKRNW
jgi:SH3-like domain-containing protein